MQLMMIQAEDGETNNMDLFVAAHNEARAIRLWRDYWDANGMDTVEGPTRVYLVIDEFPGVERVLEWSTDIPMIWSK